MAIKPPAHPTTRASNTNYVGGLRIGTPTKGAHPNAADGWQVGQKPPSQTENTYDNSTDLHAAWVDEGSSDALEEAHIKEADLNGTVSAAGFVAGETASNANGISVSPNSGSGLTGIFCSTGSGKPGAICRQIDRTVSAMILRSQVASGAGGVGVVTLENTISDGTRLMTVTADTDNEPAIVMTQAGFDSVMQVTAADGIDGVANGIAGVLLIAGQSDGGNTGGPALRCSSTAIDGNIVEISTAGTNTNGDCLSITAQNRSRGIRVTKIGGRAPGIEATSSNTGGPDQAAPLRLTPQTFDPAGEGFGDGNIYMKRLDIGGSDTVVPKVVVGGDMRSVMMARGPMCGIYEEIADTTVISDSIDDIIISQAFESGYEPVDTGSVHVSFKFWAQRTINTSTIDYISIQLEDISSGGSVFYDEDLYLSPRVSSDVTNTRPIQLEARARYSIPSAGARILRVVAVVPAAFTGDCALSQMLFEVRPVFN